MPNSNSASGGIQSPDAAIPAELRELRQWVSAGGTNGKRPVSARGTNVSRNDPSKFGDFDTVRARKGYGVGFVLPKGIICIDIDCAFDEDGKIRPRFVSLVNGSRATYVERSKSGKGLHIFVRSDVGPAGGTREAIGFADENSEVWGAVEVLGEGWFVVMTGDVYEDRPLTLDENPGIVAHALLLIHEEQAR